jgi:ribA/ribD-fused uncharacterized protein
MIVNFGGQYDFLSNFYPCAIKYDGVTYPSVEHAYQAAKTLNIVERELIRLATTPGKAKRLGRGVTMRPRWNMLRIGIMTQLVWAKFDDPQLGEMLKSTFPDALIEGNTWGDKFWGAVWENDTWVGKNILGCILMSKRTRLLNCWCGATATKAHNDSVYCDYHYICQTQCPIQLDSTHQPHAECVQCIADKEASEQWQAEQERKAELRNEQMLYGPW